MTFRPTALALAALAVATSASPACTANAASAASDQLYVWMADADAAQDDFLATLDARAGSPTYGRVVSTTPVGKRGTIPHHTEHELAADGLLFANGFKSGDTFLFDVRAAAKPTLVSSFGAPAPYRQPHSYARLPNGNVVATLQSSGEKGEGPGGLMEFTASGQIVRTVDAADAAVDDHFVPYSIAVMPSLDRLVTTSADMHERFVSKVVQVWRASDLQRLATLTLPPGPGGKEGWDPAEPRVLADGRTVMVSTFNCGLYLLEGLDTAAPSARFVHAFEGGGCALPVVIGRWWIQTVPEKHAVVVLDIADPASPREVGRVTLGDEYKPHWLASEPNGRRLVMTSYGPRILVFAFDPDTGTLAIDGAFRDAGADEPGLRMDRTDWPHGASGPAKPHGAVFGAPAAATPQIR
jgi:hypothetical protein